MRKSLLFLSGYLIALCVFGQMAEEPSKFKVFGQWRNYYLGTINEGDLKDFHGLATGGKLGIKYATGRLTFQMVGYTSINTGIQDLTQPDPTTGRISRYEAGLFDANDLTKRVVAIPGEVFIGYKQGGHEVMLGRMKLVTPFINPQDGRMIPTLEQGLWYSYQSKNKLKAQVALLNAIAPRSSDRFVGIGESIGLYPVGRNLDGTSSGYFGNTDSDFLVMTNIDKSWSAFRVNIWNYYVDQVFNTTYAQLTWKEKDRPLSVGVEWVHQERVKDGGNSDNSLTYFADQSSNLIGGELVYKRAKQTFKIGYDYILSGGRFIFPREWGRENLYTFQKRERSEGSADNHAMVVTYDRSDKLGASKLRSIISVGHQWKADVTDPADNKYAQPSYRHINLDFFYMHDQLNKLQPELLLTIKQGLGDFPNNPNFILNKVNIYQANLILNYTF